MLSDMAVGVAFCSNNYLSIILYQCTICFDAAVDVPSVVGGPLILGQHSRLVGNDEFYGYVRNVRLVVLGMAVKYIY